MNNEESRYSIINNVTSGEGRIKICQPLWVHIGKNCKIDSLYILRVMGRLEIIVRSGLSHLFGGVTMKIMFLLDLVLFLRNKFGVTNENGGEEERDWKLEQTVVKRGRH